jgi:hypothetical protein
LGVTITRVGDQEFAIQDPGSPFLIEFHPVEFEGEPLCLEHAALAWVSEEELHTMALAPSDHQYALFLKSRTLNGPAQA